MGRSPAGGKGDLRRGSVISDIEMGIRWEMTFGPRCVGSTHPSHARGGRDDSPANEAGARQDTDTVARRAEG